MWMITNVLPCSVNASCKNLSRHCYSTHQSDHSVTPPQVLCAHGAHVNAPGYKGMRPLHEAVENGHGELARLLLAYGADPALTTYAGQTCIALCADAQTNELMEGYLADLKGRPGTMWHFSGPASFFGEYILYLLLSRKQMKG